MPTQREFDALQQQVRVLSRELAIRPVRTPSRGGGASGDSNIIYKYTKTDHGWDQGIIVRFNPGIPNANLGFWETADILTASPLDVFGIIMKVIDVDTVDIGVAGYLKVPWLESFALTYKYRDHKLSVTPGYAIVSEVPDDTPVPIRLYRTGAEWTDGIWWYGAMAGVPLVRESNILIVNNGQILYALVGVWPQVKGIKRGTTPINTVPTVTPDSNSNAYPDGVGVGRIQIPYYPSPILNNSPQWLLIGSSIIDAYGNNYNAGIVTNCAAGATALCMTKTQMNVVGGGVADAYIPFAV